MLQTQKTLMISLKSKPQNVPWIWEKIKYHVCITFAYYVHTMKIYATEHMWALNTNNALMRLQFIFNTRCNSWHITTKFYAPRIFHSIYNSNRIKFESSNPKNFYTFLKYTVKSLIRLLSVLWNFAFNNVNFQHQLCH